MAFQMLEMSDPQDGISENGTLKRWSRAAVPSFKTSCVTSWRWERTSECRGCDRCKGLGHPAVAKPWVGRWFIPLFKRNRHKDDECRHVVLFGKINHQKDCKDFGGSATSESPSWYSQFFPFAKKRKENMLRDSFPTCSPMFKPFWMVSQHVSIYFSHRFRPPKSHHPPSRWVTSTPSRRSRGCNVPRRRAWRRPSSTSGHRSIAHSWETRRCGMFGMGWWEIMEYPLVNLRKTMEHHHF